MRRKGKTTVFLKECMADALLKLVENEPLDKITVQQITDLAGVGRATWFRNFSSKSDALTFKLIQVWERWADEHNLTERRHFSADNAKTFFEFNYSIRNILEIIYRAGSSSVVHDAFQSVMGAQRGANQEECYQSRFYYSGLYGLLDEWIKRGFCETPKEMAGVLRKIVNKDAATASNAPVYQRPGSEECGHRGKEPAGEPEPDADPGQSPPYPGAEGAVYPGI